MPGPVAAASDQIDVASQRRPSPWTLRSVGVIALLITCLFLLRLPSALVPREFNVDESLLLSQAMKFAIDPRPWIAADVETSGPLNSYFVSGFLLLGIKPTFVLVHILADALVCANVLVAYLTLRRLGSEISARFGTLVLVLFYGLTSSANFLHYSGELLPALFINIGFYLIVRLLETSWHGRPGNGNVFACLGGVALGAAPWCKLQASPISVSLALFALAVIWRSRRRPLAERAWRLRAFALMAGFSLTSIAMLGILVKCGALRDFWLSYIVNNLAFAGPLSFMLIFVHVLLLLAKPLLQLSLLGSAVVIYIFAKNNSPALSARERWIWAGILIYLCSALLAAARVTYLFSHHATWAVMPLTYAVAGIADRGLFMPSGHGGKRQWLLVSTAGLFFAASLALYALYAVRYVRMVTTFDGGPAPNHPSLFLGSPQLHLEDTNERIFAVVQRLRPDQPVRSATVWGWQPGVYVLADIPPSTRYTDMNFLISRGPEQTFFMANFLNDLLAKPPDLFIDAVVPGAFPDSVTWTDHDGYESDPELKKYIDENYVLADQLTLVNGEKPVRFFLRKAERLPVPQRFHASGKEPQS